MVQLIKIFKEKNIKKLEEEINSFITLRVEKLHALSFVFNPKGMDGTAVLVYDQLFVKPPKFNKINFKINTKEIMDKKKKVVSHLKGDIKTFKKEIKEDKELIKSVKQKPKSGKKK